MTKSQLIVANYLVSQQCIIRREQEFGVRVSQGHGEQLRVHAHTLLSTLVSSATIWKALSDGVGMLAFPHPYFSIRDANLSNK